MIYKIPNEMHEFLISVFYQTYIYQEHKKEFKYYM